MTVFYGIAKELKFNPDNQRGWLDFLEKNDGKKIVINANLDKAKRSLDQNSYYWAYLEIIANEKGESAERLHKLFKGLFLPKTPMTFNGKTYMMSGSTADLNKPQFSEYLEKICAESEVPLPDPKLLHDSGKIVYKERDESDTPTLF